MAITVTIIKAGRSDAYGRPLLVNTQYSLDDEFAKALVASLYATDTFGVLSRPPNPPYSEFGPVPVGTVGTITADPIRVTWSGKSSTSIAATSDLIYANPAAKDFYITADANVTNATVTVRGYTDTAFTQFASLGTVSFLAGGTKNFKIGPNLPYTAYVVVVIVLTGGTISSSIVSDSVADSGASTDPTKTGIPGISPVVISEWSIPIIAHGAGVMSNNGAFVLGTALPLAAIAFGACYMSFKANEIFAGSSAGVYYVQMSSTTAGTVFNDALAANTLPTIVSSPTAFASTGAGAFIVSAADVNLLTLTYPGGIPGPNGALWFKIPFALTGIAGNSVSITVAGTKIKAIATSTSQGSYVDAVLRALGSNNLQIASALAIPSDNVTGGGPVAYALGMDVNYTVLFSVFGGDATANVCMMGGTVLVIPS